MKKKRLIVSLIILCFLNVASTSWSDTEIIYPDADSGGYNWNDGTGSNCWDEINDASEADYCSALAKNDIQVVTLADPTGIGGSDTINSLTWTFRFKEDGGERLRFRLLDISSTNECSWQQFDGTSSWATQSDTAQTTACDGGGSWTLAHVNDAGLMMSAIVVGKDTSVSWDVAWAYVTVDYTPAAASTFKGQIIISWLPEEERYWKEIEDLLKLEETIGR